MPLSVDERVRIRHHMGYLQVADAYTFVLGSPASVETTFIIEGAMDRVLEAAIPLMRKILQTLDAIETQSVDDLELLAVTSLGEIDVNTEELPKLERQYDKWVAKLSNMLGCPRNPFDKRFAATSGVNVGVCG
jgi:hypothetical protein